MAIVIPSKHIYDKDNNKIRDNKIDRVEVNATEIKPDNKYETPVYNEKIIIENYSTYSEKNTSSKALGTNEEDAWTFNYGVGVAKTQITRMYCSGTIKIPKLKNNILIEKILSKTDNEGNARIKYSSRCTKKIGTVSQNEVLTETIHNANSIAGIYVETSVTNNTIGNNNRTFTSEKNGEILPDTSIYEDTISFNQKYQALGKEFSVTSETTYPDNLTNLGSLDVTYNEVYDEYQFTYKLLCGIGFDKLGYSKKEDFNTIGNPETMILKSDISLSGETEFYFPDQVEITVYGNTIGIDLTDKTVYIPDENGNKPFSVEGKELMQTSNYYTLKQVDDKDLISPTSYWVGKSNYNNYAYYTSVHIDGEKNSWETYVDYKDTKDGIIKTVIIPPRQNTHSPALETTEADTIEIIKVYKKNSICSQFQDTLLEYSNGKETATILCDIYNYVDAVKFKVLEYELLEDGSVYCRLKTDNINDLLYIFKNGCIYVNNIEGFIQDIDEDQFILMVYFNDASVINDLEKGEITINKKLFYFNIGDVVIPMVYGANGVDKPMSKYKDGTPKKFKVLGNRIFYDGAVWQELTLQETLE